MDSYAIACNRLLVRSTTSSAQHLLHNIFWRSQGLNRLSMTDLASILERDDRSLLLDLPLACGCARFTPLHSFKHYYIMDRCKYLTIKILQVTTVS